MSDFDFSRNSSGNYQATIGYTDTRVTIQTFADKIYVDIRDYFNKDAVFFPTKRGVTLTKTEWQQLCAQADQTGNSVVRIIEELANDKQPTLPIDITVTDELKQSIRLFNWSTSFGPHRSTRIAISKTKAGENPARLREIVLKPVHWFSLIIHNRERIDMLIDMLEKETSLAAGKRKQHALAAERSLFQATWSLPSLQVDQPYTTIQVDQQ